MPFWRRAGEGNTPVPRHLPPPSGPHAVGFQDVMTPGDGKTGVFMRVYYPTALPVSETTKQHQLWPVWADDDYLLGMINFMQAMLQKWPSWAPRAEYKFIDQTSYLGPLMHHGAVHIWKLLNGKVHCPILKNMAISREKKWPVIVFSHGLGCSRFAYSRICTDLASHGFVVGATEHRDGSACLSFHMKEGTKTWIPHRQNEEGEKEYVFRNNQLKHRVREVKDTLSLLLDLNKGEKVKNVLEANGGEKEFDLEMFKGSMDASSPILVGHSFGGATSLLTLHEDSRFKQGVVLDGWLFPIRDESFQPSQPMVFINTESFMHKMNIGRMKMFLRGTNEDRRVFYIKGSVHQNHIDAPCIFQSNFVKKLIGMYSDTDPLLVLELNNKLMLHFIWNHLGQETPGEVTEFLDSHHDVLVEASENDKGILSSSDSEPESIVREVHSPGLR